jgi:hypothetical protein
VTEKTMSAATTSQFATLAASDVMKGGVASFGSRPMKPGLADFTSLSLVDRYMLVHEISAALYENARPRDDVLCTAWADAIGRHRYVETNHPVRPGEVLKGEVELKGASGVKVTFHPRCATDAKAVLTVSWTTGKGVDAVTTTKTFSGAAAGQEGSKWPTAPLEVGSATKVSYAFSSPAGVDAAWGVGFTVSGDMSEANLESTVQRQINEVVFASKQLLTQWTREMDADLAALARSIADASGGGKKGKRKRRGSDSGSGSGSDDDSTAGDDDDDEEEAGKAPAFTVEDMPMQFLLLRNETDGLQYPSLSEVPVPQLRMRFQLMVQFNKLLKDALPAFSLSSTKPWSVGYRLRNLSHVVFYEIKKRVLDNAISASKGSGHIDTLYLSNFKASESESRGDVTPETSQCMFVQAYYHLRKVPSAAMRSLYDSDQDKVFEVQFRGESGIDAGGVYREGLSRIMDDLFSDRFGLLMRVPNSRAVGALNADRFVPNPAHRSPLALSMLEFAGRFMGLSLRTKACLPFLFPSLVWKALVGEKPTFTDLAQFDTPLADTLDRMRHCDEAMYKGAVVTPITDDDGFRAAFGEVRFTLRSLAGEEVELVPGGRDVPVTFASRLRYAEAAEAHRLHECDVQLAALRRGLANVVPIRALSLFTWQECEVLVAGSPVIDVEVLKRHTRYEAFSASDPVIKRFWEVFEGFTPEQRYNYVRFVWGRSRLPAPGARWSSEHTISSHSGGDKALPMAHTCFFTIDLPAYSSVERMRWGLTTAVAYGLGGILNG